MKLKAKISELPKTPGVYLLKDSRGRVLYIGKARSLRNRVANYLRKNQPSPKISAMVRKIRDVDYLETGSEMEALLTECRLVKDIQPKYNTELKDDKSFPSIEVTLGDPFPAVRFVRQREEDESAFYGPFTDATSLRAAIKAIQKIFRFRTCRLTIAADDRARRFARPCLLFYIECCSAPCTNRISREEYRKDIEGLLSFLDGNKEQTLAALRSRMELASSRLEYERATIHRNQIKSLEFLDRTLSLDDVNDVDIGPMSPEAGVELLQERLQLENPPRIIDGVDISSISGKEATGSKVTFVDGIPFKDAYRRYKIRCSGRDDYEMIAEVVRRRFSRAVREGERLPDLLLVDGGAGHVSQAAQVLKGLKVAIPCIGLAKKNEELFLPGRRRPLRLAANDPALRMLQCVRDEAHRFAQRYHRLLRKKKLNARSR